MRILLLTQYFPPETGSAAVKMAEVGEFLASRGHKVRVVAQVPNYPEGIYYPGYQGVWFRREFQNGLEVCRTYAYASPERRRFRPRLVNYLSFMMTSVPGMLAGWRPEVALVYSPPLFLGLSAAVLRGLWGCPFVLWVNDLWPRAALSLGFLREGSLYRFACRMERFIYRRAARLVVYSARMGEEVVKGGALRERVEVHPLWVDTGLFRPDPEGAREIRRRHGWRDDFVVLYGGNLGLAQGLEVFLESARILRENSRIRWVLVGSGPEKEHLVGLAARYGLTRVEFIPHQPKEKVRAYFSAAEVLFAHLKAAPHRVGTIPEKLLAYMACGRPVLLAAQEGAAVELVREHRCGLTVPPDNPEALAGAVRTLLRERHQLEALGAAGRRAAESRYAAPLVLEALEASLLRVAQGG